MSEKIYTIIDIETTGGRAARDKITEIAIVRHDGKQVLDSWESLINPECAIPYGITELTGITNEMVREAPKFFEVARKVVEMTEGAIFVAHNVRFDYSFIQEEFRRLGYTFSRRKLCTVRMSRQAFPGLPSYSLGKLIRHFNIKVDDRHRAMADTLATTTLFEMILGNEENEASVKNMINLGVREALLPKHWTIDKIMELPDECGVYYFHDEPGNVIYVGKSKNIRKRVAEHFKDKTSKGSKLHRYVHDVSYELTGSELVALLLESEEIKRLRPPINRAQRMTKFPWVIYTYTNEDGYICYDHIKVTAKTRKNYQIVGEFPKQSRAKGRLARLVREYELCDKLCHLERTTQTCFKYHLKQCQGACRCEEPSDTYNERALAAQSKMGVMFEEDFFVIDRGREPKEHTVILVENGEYQGFGFIDETAANGIEKLRDAIKPYQNNPETKRLIARFMSDNERLRVLRF